MASLEGNHISTVASDAIHRSDDRFLWGFPLFAVACEIFLVVLSYLARIIHGSEFVAILFFILIELGMIVVALVGIVFLIKGKFKRAASLLLPPFIVASPLLIPIGPYENLALDWLRFVFTKEKYAQVIDQMPPAERALRVVLFDWGSEGFAGIGNSQYYLVYDERGEIALPEEQRSQAWKDNVKKKTLYFTNEKCPPVVYRLSGHYYSAALFCID